MPSDAESSTSSATHRSNIQERLLVPDKASSSSPTIPSPGIGTVDESFDKIIEELEGEVACGIDEGEKLIESFKVVENEVEMRSENAPSKRSIDSINEPSSNTNTKLTPLGIIMGLPEPARSQILNLNSAEEKMEALGSFLNSCYDQLSPVGKKYVGQFPEGEPRIQAMLQTFEKEKAEL